MTFPPICGPGGGGGGPQPGPTPTATFPPVCGGGQTAPQVGLAFTGNGTVVEPRCFFPTQSGDTCPRNWCNMLPTFDRIFCYPRTLVLPGCFPQNMQQQVGAAPTGPRLCDPPNTYPPVCPDPAQAQAQAPQPYTIYPQYTCGFICNTAICGHQAAGGTGQFGGPTPTATFPPVCHDPAQAQAQPYTVYPQYTCGFICNTQICGAPQAAEAQVGAGFTATGTVVEPRCFFQTQVGTTCPPRRCEFPVPTFESIRGCPPPKSVLNPIDCLPDIRPNTQTGETCPRTICSSFGIGCPRGAMQVGAQAPQPYTVYPQYTCGFICNTAICGHQQAAGGGGQFGGPTPTATFPPVCHDPAQAQAQAYTIYPQYTCGFVCNTQFPPCGEPQQQAQVGAIFTGTLVSPRCLRTIDIVVCQPTTRGDTCPPTICTIAGVGCPMRPMQAQVGFGGDVATVNGFTCPRTSCDQPIQTVTGLTCPANFCQVRTTFGVTCPIQACYPTLFGYTCPRQWCWGAPEPVTVSGQTCPAQLCDPAGGGFGGFVGAPGGGGFDAAAVQIQPTLQLICQPTLFSATCPVCPPTLTGQTCPLCPPTIVGRTCPRVQCFPTLSGNTCPWQFCQPTLFGATCPVCPPTLTGQTCPWQVCRPTVFNPQCQFEPGPVIPQPGPQFNPQPEPPGVGAGAVTIVGQTCPFFICQPTFNLCPPPQ